MKDANITLFNTHRNRSSYNPIKGEVSGYLMTYDDEPDLAGDVIERGAMDNVISDFTRGFRRLPVRFEHKLLLDTYWTLDNRKEGLFVSCVVPQQFKQHEAWGRLEAMHNGTLFAGLSPQIIVIKSRKHPYTTGRIIMELDLVEGSITQEPVNTNAVAVVKSKGKVVLEKSVSVSVSELVLNAKTRQDIQVLMRKHRNSLSNNQVKTLQNKLYELGRSNGLVKMNIENEVDKSDEISDENVLIQKSINNLTIENKDDNLETRAVPYCSDIKSKSGLDFDGDKLTRIKELFQS